MNKSQSCLPLPLKLYKFSLSKKKKKNSLNFQFCPSFSSQFITQKFKSNLFKSNSQNKQMMMLDPANDLLPPPSSPTISSVSSSDLDTESTGSFFHDRSTTLGTLMGVTFPVTTFRAPSRSHSQHHQFQPNSANGSSAVSNRRKSKKNRSASDEEERRRWRRRRWWRLCIDDGDCMPASLGEFLEVERRFGDGAAINGGGAVGEIEGVVAPVDDHNRNGRILFADGRVLPPAEVDEAESSVAAAVDGGLCGFSAVLLSGICSGGGVG